MIKYPTLIFLLYFLLLFHFFFFSSILSFSFLPLILYFFFPIASYLLIHSKPQPRGLARRQRVAAEDLLRKRLPSGTLLRPRLPGRAAAKPLPLCRAQLLPPFLALFHACAVCTSRSFGPWALRVQTKARTCISFSPSHLGPAGPNMEERAQK